MMTDYKLVQKKKHVSKPKIIHRYVAILERKRIAIIDDDHCHVECAWLTGESHCMLFGNLEMSGSKLVRAEKCKAKERP